MDAVLAVGVVVDADCFPPLEHPTATRTSHWVRPCPHLFSMALAPTIGPRTARRRLQAASAPPAPGPQMSSAISTSRVWRRG